MSLPTEFDFAVLKLGDGAGPEVYTVSCGKNDISLTFAANSSDRFVRDCAKPGEVPFRKKKATGKMLDVQAAGLTDVDAFETEIELVGQRVNSKIEFYVDDGSDAGDLIGTVACNVMVDSLEIGAPREGESSSALSLSSHGAWTWTAAA